MESSDLKIRRITDSCRSNRLIDSRRFPRQSVRHPNCPHVPLIRMPVLWSFHYTLCNGPGAMIRYDYGITKNNKRHHRRISNAVFALARRTHSPSHTITDYVNLTNSIFRYRASEIILFYFPNQLRICREKSSTARGRDSVQLRVRRFRPACPHHRHNFRRPRSGVP